MTALKCKPDKFKKLVSTEESSAPLLKFFSEDECSVLYFLDGAKDMTCFNVPPAGLKKKLLCFLKPSASKYAKAEEMSGVMLFDLSPKLLESMHATLEGVFLPIMSNPRNQQARCARGQL